MFITFHFYRDIESFHVIQFLNHNVDTFPLQLAVLLFTIIIEKKTCYTIQIALRINVIIQISNCYHKFEKHSKEHKQFWKALEQMNSMEGVWDEWLR